MATLESQGVKLQVGAGDGPPETFADVGQVVDISGLRGGQATVIDVSNLASTRREKIMGLADEGQLNITVQYDPADVQQTRLETLRGTRALGNFKVLLTDSGPTTFAFSGYVLSFSVDFAVDQVIQGSITIEITGAVTKS